MTPVRPADPGHAGTSHADSAMNRLEARGRTAAGKPVAGIGEFLLARIAEDEVLARAASDAPWQHHAGNHQVTTADGIEVATAFALSGKQQQTNAAHIARHDPARALSDCLAKRWVIQQCAAAADSQDGERVATLRLGILRALALPYNQHPSYRAQWSVGPTEVLRQSVHQPGSGVADPLLAQRLYGS